MPLHQIELLFPPELIPAIGDARSLIWRNFVNSTIRISKTPVEQAAFVLMITRLVNCVSCNANSFRAAQGCTFCSTQAIKRFHGSDEELINMFNKARVEVNEYLTKYRYGI
jgi:hypothetical protein